MQLHMISWSLSFFCKVSILLDVCVFKGKKYNLQIGIIFQIKPLQGFNEIIFLNNHGETHFVSRLDFDGYLKNLIIRESSPECKNIRIILKDSVLTESANMIYSPGFMGLALEVKAFRDWLASS
jgi:hypothetical protein